jgi:hypothetical protein
MKILDDLTIDGNIRQNSTYDLDTDKLTCRAIHLSSQDFGAPDILLENALNLSNNTNTTPWRGGGQIRFRRRFGNVVPQDKDRIGSIFFEGKNNNNGWSSCAAIYAECADTIGVGSEVVPGNLKFATTPKPSDGRPLTRMFINSDGNVGIGTTAPEKQLHINGGLQFENGNIIYGKNTDGISESCLIPRSSGNNPPGPGNATFLNYGENGLYIRNSSGEQAIVVFDSLKTFFRDTIRIESYTGDHALIADGPIKTIGFVKAENYIEGNTFYIGSPSLEIQNKPNIARNSNDGSLELNAVQNSADIRFKTRNQLRMIISKDGSVGINTDINESPNATLQVNGNIASATGKTFIIDHPLDPTNKTLIHGCVESPRYDLLYRGTVVLNSGKAVVDIDAASNMSEGTFAALAQNVEVACLTNKTSYSRVKATNVINGKFTIECEDPNSNDTIFWMVAAERQDSGIFKSDARTDKNGCLIPEWKKTTP